VAVAIVGISIVNLGISVDQTKPVPEGYREASAVLMDSVQPGDAIVVIGFYQFLGLNHYLPEGTPTQKLVASRDNPGSWVILDKDGNEFQTNRIWILDKGPAKEGTLGNWIQRRFPLIVMDEWFGLIRLQLRETSGG
jgi:hypothetical protein